MPTIRPGIGLDPRDVLPFYRIWRRITFRPLNRYTLYMIRPDPDTTDRLACKDEVIGVNRLTPERVTIEVIYNDLLSLREREYGEGLINALYESNLRLESAYVNGVDVAHIELSGTLVATEICSMPRIKSQLEEPAKQLYSGIGHVRGTVVHINGRPLELAVRTR